MAAVAAICLTASAHAGALDCRPAEGGDYRDPLGRDGLSALICPLPKPGQAVVIVTDTSLSWPVLMTSTGTVSFEDEMLGNTLDLPGLPYFNPAQDQVVHFTDPERLFISVTTSDPVTLSPARVWVRIDTLTGHLATW